MPTAAAPAKHRPLAPEGDGPTIIVGYDGSEESRLAVAVAIERAGPEGTVIPLHVTDPASDWLGTPYNDRNAATNYRTAQALLADIDQVVTGSTAVEPETIEGRPADALLRVAQSRGATEIVVGSRARGRFRSILGSVARDLLQRSDRPIVIVPKGAGNETV
jgi:nucleotide-binding universal stress UspA family protein